MSPTENPTRNEQIRLTEEGKADAPYQFFSAKATERLVRLYPSQVHLTPTNGGGVVGFWLRTDHGVFARRDARRALSFAADRRLFAAIAPFYVRPACQAISPGFQGYAPYCPYTLGGTADGAPDLARGRSLLRGAGAAGAVVHVATWKGLKESDWQYRWLPWQTAMLQTLRRVGFRLEEHAFKPTEEQARDDYVVHHADLDLEFGPGEGTVSVGDVFSYFTGDCARPPILGTFCDARTRHLMKLDGALRDGPDRVRNWTALDRHLTDEAAWLPLTAGVNVVFLSRRVGNYGFQPATGGSLWDLMTVN
jgi:peptide/nickel transport system substrate-binding protein